MKTVGIRLEIQEKSCDPTIVAGLLAADGPASVVGHPKFLHPENLEKATSEGFMENVFRTCRGRKVNSTAKTILPINTCHIFKQHADYEAIERIAKIENCNQE